MSILDDGGHPDTARWAAPKTPAVYPEPWAKLLKEARHVALWMDDCFSRKELRAAVEACEATGTTAATPPESGDPLKRMVCVGDLPAPITNSEAWPPNYADGFNAACELQRQCAPTYPPESGGQGETPRTAMAEAVYYLRDYQNGGLRAYSAERAGELADAIANFLATTVTHPPAQVSGAVTEAMVVAACRAHDPMYESCGSDTRADMRAGIRRALEAALAQGGGNER